VLTRPVGKIGNFLSFALIIMAALISLSACAQNGTTGGNSQGQSGSNSQKPVTIGFSASITGDFSADGKALQKGYELWGDSVNKRGGLLGRKVQLKFYDDGSEADQAVTNYQKLIGTDHVDLVFGPFSTLINAPSVRVADRYGYAFLEGAGNGPKVFKQDLKNKNLFAVTLPSETYLEGFVRYILSLPQDQRPKSVAYITVDNPFAVPQVAHAKQLLTAAGVKSVFESQPYPENINDVSPIAKQVVHANPDVVIIGTVGVNDCVNFIKSFKQQHFNPKAFIATAGPDEGAEFTKAVGTDSTEGIFVPNSGWFPGVKNYQNDQFSQEYSAKYGGTAEDINSATVQAYAAGQVLEQAVNQAKSLDNKVLIKTLHEGSFKSLFGDIKFNDKGQNTVGVPYLFQWQGGKLIPVYPDNQAQAKPQYPKKTWV
jgi:branched-chain amino acid transport system substrate-binding protein